jgi:hypothetical protein
VNLILFFKNKYSFWGARPSYGTTVVHALGKIPHTLHWNDQSSKRGVQEAMIQPRTSKLELLLLVNQEKKNSQSESSKISTSTSPLLPRRLYFQEHEKTLTSNNTSILLRLFTSTLHGYGAQRMTRPSKSSPAIGHGKLNPNSSIHEDLPHPNKKPKKKI